MDNKYYEEGMDDMNEDCCGMEGCEACNESETTPEREPTFKEKLRSKTINFLQKTLSNPRVWYVAGMIDTMIILFVAKKFLF